MAALLQAALSFALAVSQIGAPLKESQISLARPLSPNDPDLPEVVQRLADKVLALDPENDPLKKLDNRVRLELASGRFEDAARDAAQLDVLAEKQAGTRSVARLLYRRWSLYAEAKAVDAARSGTFASAYAGELRKTLGSLSSRDSYALEYSFGTPLAVLQANLDAELRRDNGATSLSAQQAVALIRAYEAFEAYRKFQPLADSVAAEDDSRRYVVDKDVSVPTPDGATICALIVRPRTSERLPTLLNFTIYDDPLIKLDDARRTAANGYPGVIGFTRGKGCSPQTPIPMIHDGADADTLIDWIARQPWSDGRVGMFGGSYEGFTQWAATKHLPSALKAIMPSVSFSPGVDFPMDGGIFLSYGFPWPLYTTDNKFLDDKIYFDDERWNKMQRDWYLSGKAYRDLDEFAGVKNPIWDSWLAHPAYDEFWRDLKPTDAELAKLNIPVLVTTGYYDSGQSGALSYWTRYARANPKAENYLVVGPWDHHTAQLGTVNPFGTASSASFRGLRLDAAAQFDIIALRYQWFDWVFGRGPKPTILEDHVNYEVMGENRWRHAPSLEAMGSYRRFYLSRAGAASSEQKLSASPVKASSVSQRIDFKDRTDVASFGSNGLIDQTLDDWPILTRGLDLAHSVVYQTAPLSEAMEVSGLFRASLSLTVNKKDFDFAITLFDITPKGDWYQLSYDWQRASYVKDPSVRHLLVSGRRTRLDVTARRTTSFLLPRGDRLAVVLSLLKQPGEEINYGTGGLVNEETISDAGEPLQILWFGDSWVDVPVASEWDHSE